MIKLKNLIKEKQMFILFPASIKLSWGLQDKLGGNFERKLF